MGAPCSLGERMVVDYDYTSEVGTQSEDKAGRRHKLSASLP